ncbi:single-stranded DNA-binding protein [Elizabethkingia anophelis]|uniref:single-stranded DNA-binding protein n=1 Tax=Elizabethkingia anophelis TaxID=1117645 RepID=UPI00136B49FA|nr:single-stranded DNA-binding protein [Elizabethkingia anophelis]MYY43984.1 single-stranded DNA-binding protein [Elizabethkingia anophelis]
MNILARLTSDAVVNTTPKGKQVVNFSVAVNDHYRNKQGERVNRTSYFDCSYWLSPGVAKILTKGLLVELTGKVSARAWIDKNGEAKAGLNFHTSFINPLAGWKKKQQTDTIHQPTQGDDDLPF